MCSLFTVHSEYVIAYVRICDIIRTTKIRHVFCLKFSILKQTFFERVLFAERIYISTKLKIVIGYVGLRLLVQLKYVL